MYIKDDIVYAGELTPMIDVIEAKPLEGHMLLVTFSTGEKRLFDATQLTGPVFEPLKDEKFFRDITLFHGVITWDNKNIDIAPEFVYENSFKYDYDYDLIDKNYDL